MFYLQIRTGTSAESIIMQPTDFNNEFFLNFLFKAFSWIVPLYRKAEKQVIQIQKKKERIKFLKKCLDEKVLPTTFEWVKRLDNDSPFPAESVKVIKAEIENLKEDVDDKYYRLRRSKMAMFQQLPDNLEHKVVSFLKTVGRSRASTKEAELTGKLQKLVENSPWTTFSQGNNIVNYSSYDLSNNQKQVLGYGLNFSLPHEKRHFFSVLEELEKLKCFGDYFNHSFVLMNLENIFYDLKNEIKDFLPKRFITALKDLKSEKSIRICKADKGGKIVIVDKSSYREKIRTLLSDTCVYKVLKKNPLGKMQTEFNKGLKIIFEKYDKKDCIKKFTSRLPSLPYMYGLPKIHKENCPYRPIISNVNSPSYKLAKWLSKQLSKSLGKFSDAHIKHNTDLLTFLKTVIPGNKRFISFDVKSLFTNVPLDVTLDFLKRKLPSLKIDFDVPVECLIELIELCLKNPCFQFEDEFFEQSFGTGMGNPLSCVLANLFLEHVESELLPLYKGVSPIFWKRYVDDCLSLVSEDFDLDDFLNFINSFYPSLKFTYEWSKNGKIPFLDILIQNCNTHLKFDIFRKETHSESYLHYFSYASESIKLGLAQSLFLRAYRICDQEFLTKEIDHVKTVLRKLAYPKKFLNKALIKAKKSHFSVSKKVTNDLNKKMIKLPYNKNLEKFRRPLNNVNTRLVFTYNNKLRQNLCKNRPKNDEINMGVYEIPCGTCKKIYVGESGRDLKKRIKEHKYDIKKANEKNGLFVHVRDFDHPIDFNNARLVYPSSSVRRRHLVESALIDKHQKIDNCVNLNKGFAYSNPLVSKYVREIAKLN